jgi:hypothetical protein
MLAETKMLSDSPACEMATIKACDVTMGVTPGIKVEIAFYLRTRERREKEGERHTLGPRSKVSTEESPQVMDRLFLYSNKKTGTHTHPQFNLSLGNLIARPAGHVLTLERKHTSTKSQI